MLREDSNRIDAGANVGDVLRQIAPYAPRGRHVAFEPLPDLAASLRRDFPDGGGPYSRGDFAARVRRGDLWTFVARP